MILVTASTGHLGHHVIDALLARIPPSQIVAGARDPSKAVSFANTGVIVRELDYTRPETLASALRDVHRALLISGSEGDRVAQHRTVIDAAKAARIEQLAYTSILHADTSTMLLAKDHQATESYLRSSGVPFVLLRNGWYNENYTRNLDAAIQFGATFGAAKDGKVSPAARADYAEAAAAILASDGHTGKAYELAGDTAYSLAEIAAEIARVSGKPVKYNNLTLADYAATLEKFGVPSAYAHVLAESDAGIARGELFDASGTLSKLIGHPTTPFGKSVEAALK